MITILELVRHVRNHPHDGLSVISCVDEDIYLNRGGFRSYRSHDVFFGRKGLREAISIAIRFGGEIVC